MRLYDSVDSTILTAITVAVPLVIYVGLPNDHDVEGVEKHQCFGFDSRLNTQDRSEV